MSIENCKICNMNIDTDYTTMEEHYADTHITRQDEDDYADYCNKLKRDYGKI